MSARVDGRVEAHPTKTSVRLSARAVVLLLLAGSVMMLGISPLRGYLEERSQLADLRKQATQLEAGNAKLQTRIDQLSDATYLEKLARECLGMVKPGETAFVIVPKHGRPTPPDC